MCVLVVSAVVGVPICRSTLSVTYTIDIASALHIDDLERLVLRLRERVARERIEDAQPDDPLHQEHCHRRVQVDHEALAEAGGLCDPGENLPTCERRRRQRQCRQRQRC